MKLNLRPKNSKQTDSRIFAHVTSYLSIFTALHLITPVCCADLAPSPTESPSVNRAVVQPERGKQAKSLGGNSSQRAILTANPQKMSQIYS